MKINKTTLKNGIRLITIPMADNPSVTVLLMVEAGSKYETKEVSGISHFLEHMVFKGTPRRPKASDISRELDSIGAHYNAFTGHEYTGYYAKAQERHTDTILDIVADMYLNPLLEDVEIKKEAGVIVEEMRMYQDMPHRHVHDVLSELLHGDQPAGWNVIGNEDTIRSFTREHFVAYRNAKYVTEATTVIAAGSFDEKEMISKVEKIFAGTAQGKKASKIPVTESQSSPLVKPIFKETDQTHLAMAFRTFPILDKRIPTMHVLSAILGSGMSSRLWSKLRDDMGICYYVRAGHNAYTDHGELNISAGVDNSRVEEAIKEILTQCKLLKDEPATAAEIKKAKDYIAGTTMLELETSESRAEFAGFQEVLKHKVDSPEEIINKINLVTAADVQKLAQEIFINAGLNMAIIGKFKDDSTFKPYFSIE